MILWQPGSCTVCTSHIGSLGQRAIWYTQLIYPLLWNEKSRIWQSLRCPRSHNQGCPCARFQIYGSLDPKLYVPAILGPWVQGLFGACSSYTLHTEESKSRLWPSLGFIHSHKQGVPVADYDFMAVWTLYCAYQPYGVCRSKVYLVHKFHIPPAVELKIAFGVTSFPLKRGRPYSRL